MNREGRAWGSCHFVSKITEHSVHWGQVRSSITHHEMGKRVERVFKKNSLKLNTASHNNTSWYTDTDGLLEYSPSGEVSVLQGACLPEDNSTFYWVPPPIK